MKAGIHQLTASLLLDCDPPEHITIQRDVMVAYRFWALEPWAPVGTDKR